MQPTAPSDPDHAGESLIDHSIAVEDTLGRTSDPDSHRYGRAVAALARAIDAARDLATVRVDPTRW